MATVGVTVTKGPADWQIIQRAEDGTGTIELEGTAAIPEKEFTVETRIVNENTGAPATSALDWQPAVADGNTFRARISGIPAGGLYRLETRAHRAGNWCARGDFVHHLGVGDIYIIAGQSNASGTARGVIDDGPEPGVHLYSQDERWRLATHPLEDSTHTRHPITIHGGFHGHSPWLHFGKMIRHATGIPVGLIPTALGGSPLCRWVKRAGSDAPQDLYENMLDMTGKATDGKMSVAGVLWYQGESDVADATRKTYAEDFARFVANVRRECGSAELPFITVQLGRYVVECPDQAVLERVWTAMRQVQREIARTVPGVYVVPALDVPLSDPIHNSAAGNVTIGERCAFMALEKIYGKPLQAAHPEPAGIVFVEGRARILITFRNCSGNLFPGGPLGDFSVEDGGGRVPVREAAILGRDRVQLTLERPAKGATIVHGAYGLNPATTLRDDSSRCLIGFSEPVG